MNSRKTKNQQISNIFTKNKKRVDADVLPKDSVKQKRSSSKGLRKEEAEKILEQFDFNPLYGPSKGIPREKRYNNALKFGLNPPSNVIQAIRNHNLDTPYLDKYL